MLLFYSNYKIKFDKKLVYMCRCSLICYFLGHLCTKNSNEPPTNTPNNWIIAESIWTPEIQANSSDSAYD